MPNWVTNKLEIIGNESEVNNIIMSIIDTEESRKHNIPVIDFEKIIPMPKEVYRGNLTLGEEPELNWYTWSIDNWGTKWNACNAEDVTPHKGFSHILYFDTAWSAVPKIIIALSEKYPNIVFNYSYFDEDLGSNLGIMTFFGGKVLAHNLNPDSYFHRTSIIDSVCSQEWEEYLEYEPECEFYQSGINDNWLPKQESNCLNIYK